VTSLKPGTPHSVDDDNPDTEVIEVSSPVSVFVDSTGRRRRLLRRLSYVFGGLCMVYGGLVSVSLAGGPVSSSAVLPLPDPRDDAEEAAGPRPAPIPAPSVSARPVEVYVADVAPRRRAAAEVTRVAETRPPVVSARPSAKPTPSATPTSAKPVESATVPASPAPSATTLVPVPTIKATPVPPKPPSSGGQGGGGEVPAETVSETRSEPVVNPVSEPAEEPETQEPETQKPETQQPTDSADPPEPSVAAEQTA
jgi:hypothetical protein